MTATIMVEPSAPIPASSNRVTLVSALRANTGIAVSALIRSWQRSLLTMTGIMVGVVAIVTLVAIMKGVQVEIRNQVEGLGANMVIIVPSKLDENGQPNPGALVGISTLSDRDVDVLRALPGVASKTVSPVSLVSGLAEYGPEDHAASSNALVVATSKEGVVLNPARIVAGRYFEDSEEHVCILSDKPKRDLFGAENPLGKKVRISGKNWTVVGVLEKPKLDGTIGASILGLSTLIYLPLKVVRNEITNSQINRIVLQTDYSRPAATTIRSMNSALLKSHGGHEDFGVLTSEKALSIVIRFLNLAQSLLVLIAAISLFVAGISIMNIMLVTVSERTREIGVRKTVGARRIDIFAQFLIEAVTLSVIGCAYGLVLSKLICTGIAHFTQLTPVITWMVMLQAVAVCVVVGVVFGVTPAVRASRLDPIDALRHE